MNHGKYITIPLSWLLFIAYMVSVGFAFTCVLLAEYESFFPDYTAEAPKATGQTEYRSAVTRTFLSAEEYPPDAPPMASPDPALTAPPGQAQDKVIRFAAMGDIMMGAEGALPLDGGAGFFREVKPYLADRDVVFANLEGPLTDRGSPTKKFVPGRSYVFRTPPSYGAHLKEAGFTVLSLANNHINDYGWDGRAQTMEVLNSLGIKHTGGIGQIAVQRVKGMRIAFIGLSPNAACQNINDIPAAAALVKKAANEPDTLVVVSFHGGAEGAAHAGLDEGAALYLGEKRGDVRRLSHAVIEAGADLVLGHGPHVPRGIEVYKGRLIAYSLGNFATAPGISVQGAAGLAPLLLADLRPDGELAGIKIVSFKQWYGLGPKLDPDEAAAKKIFSLSLDMLNPKWTGMLHQAQEQQNAPEEAVSE